MTTLADEAHAARPLAECLPGAEPHATHLSQHLSPSLPSASTQPRPPQLLHDMLNAYEYVPHVSISMYPPRHAAAMHPEPPLNPDLNLWTGEEACLEFPCARPPHWIRRHRRLHSGHHEALRGEQAGGGRPRRRLPAAVAAGAPGLQLPRGPLDEAARRRLRPALGGWQREQLRGRRFYGACLRDARRSPDRTPCRDGTRRNHVL